MNLVIEEGRDRTKTLILWSRLKQMESVVFCDSKVEIADLKDIYMLLLLHLNEYFDDDILSDCIDLLM